MKLSQAVINRITLPAGKQDHIEWDEALPGFGLRVRAGGSRGYVVQYRLGAKQRRMTLGSVKELTVEKARAAAKDVLAKVHLGDDPAGDRAKARATAADTLKAVAERYLEWQEPRLRPSSYKSAKLYLLGGDTVKHLKPLHGLRLDKITRAEIASLLSIIAKGSGAVTADRVRSNLSSLYAWAIGEGIVETNPTIGVTKHAADIKPRDRVLSDAELVAIWNAVPERAQHYGSVIKLLMLTGCRADEIGGLKWSEVDLERKLISLPEDRVKNANPIDIPLSDLALDVLSRVDRREGRDLIFGIREGSFQGWSKAKLELDAKLNLPAWRVHDIRRSVATGMAELGVLPHLIEAVLNHLSGHKRGVAGVYNRATYSEEKRKALDTWAHHVAVILAQADGANIHRLQRA